MEDQVGLEPKQSEMIQEIGWIYYMEDASMRNQMRDKFRLVGVIRLRTLTKGNQ